MGQRRGERSTRSWMSMVVFLGVVASLLVSGVAGPFGDVALAEDPPPAPPVQVGSTLDPSNPAFLCSGAETEVEAAPSAPLEERTFYYFLTVEQGQTITTTATLYGIPGYFGVYLDYPNSTQTLLTKQYYGVEGQVVSNEETAGATGTFVARVVIGPVNGGSGTIKGSPVTIVVNGEGDCGPDDEEALPCNEGADVGPQGTAADPVMMQSGAMMESAPGVGVRSEGVVPLQFVPRYSSVFAGEDRGLGRGWSYSFSDRLLFDGSTIPASNQVTWWQASCAKTTFTQVPIGKFHAKPGTTATLAPDGTDYVVSLKDEAATLRFDSTGRLVSTTDRFGYVTTVSYNGSGQLSSITEDADLGGRSLTVSWVNGRIDKVTDPAGREVEYDYTGDDLTSVTDVGDAVTTFEYTSHLLEKVTDPLQNAKLAANPSYQPLKVVNTWSGGKVTLQTDNRVSGGLRTKFEYDTPVAGATTVTFAEGTADAKQRVDYYAGGRLVKVKAAPSLPEEVVVTYTYDPRVGRVSKVYNETEATVVAETSFDDAGRVESVWAGDRTLVDGSGNPTTPRTDFANYSAFGQPGTVTVGAQDPTKAQTTTFTYDATYGTLLELAVTEAEDPPPNVRTTKWFYDSPSRPSVLTKMTDPNNKDWVFTRQWVGNAPNQQLVTTAKDPLHNRSRVRFDKVGRVLWSETPEGFATTGDPNDFKTTYLTNAYGQVTQVTDADGGIWKTEYDANGRVSATVDPNWTTAGDPGRTEFHADDAGRVFEVVRGAGAAAPLTTQSSYTVDGLVKTETDAAGAVTSYAYDDLGRPTSTTDPLSRVTLASYDGLSRLEKVTQPGGTCPSTSCITYGYDDWSRLKTVSYSDQFNTPDITNITYDALGRPLVRTETQTNFLAAATVWTTEQSYDSLGRVNWSKDRNGTELEYEYDPAGRLTTITYPNGQDVTRGYDNAGRLTSVSDWAGRTFSVTPDKDSRITAIGYPSGSNNTDSFGYDESARLTNVSHKTSGTVFATMGYGRRPAGQLETGTFSGVPGAASETYAYTDVGQLASVDGGTTTFGYDLAENLELLPDGARQEFDTANQLCFHAPPGVTGGTCAAKPSASTKYGYDSRGNRISEAVPGELTTSYGYDAANRLRSIYTVLQENNDGDYNAIDPARIYDTQTATPIAAGADAEVQVAGAGGLPSTGISAVVVNLIAAAPTADGHLTAYASDEALPSTSNLNFTTGSTESNMAVVPLGADGKIKVRNGASTGTTHVIVDVQGWFANSDEGTSGGTYAALTPARLYDSRPIAKIPANSYIDVTVAGQAGVPSNASLVAAVAVNLTVTNNSQSGWLAAYSTGTPGNPPTNPPGTSNLNFDAAETRAGFAQPQIGSDGKVRIYNGSGADVDVIVDIFGWYRTTESWNEAIYTPTAPPERVYDSRTSPGTVIPANTTITVQAAEPGTTAASVNLTVTGATGAGVLTAWASGTQPATSNLNYTTGATVANAAIVKLHTDGTFKIRVGSASTHVIVDVNGTFTPIWPQYTYDYDADNLRTGTNPPANQGNTTHFTYSRSGGLPLLLAETERDPTTGAAVGDTYWIYGAGGLPLERINPDGSAWYYHHDQLGSTRTITDQTGAVIGTYSWDAYGNPNPNNTGPDPKLGWAGEYRDAETGYIYLRNRHYDPTTGQFLARDPVEAITRSPYSYVYGDPVNGRDPLGLWDCWNPTDSDCWSEAGDNLWPDESAQGTADLAGGILNGITLGHADVFVDESKVNWNSGVTKFGNVVGIAIDVPLLVPSAATGLGLGSGTMVSAASVQSTVGYLTFAGGLYDTKQAWDVCQISPGTSACHDAVAGAFFNTAFGGSIAWLGGDLLGSLRLLSELLGISFFDVALSESCIG